MKLSTLNNAKIKLEAVMRYAEDALETVNSLIESEDVEDDEEEEVRHPDDR